MQQERTATATSTTATGTRKGRDVRGGSQACAGEAECTFLLMAGSPYRKGTGSRLGRSLAALLRLRQLVVMAVVVLRERVLAPHGW
jgi:hypothetical protein